MAFFRKVGNAPAGGTPGRRSGDLVPSVEKPEELDELLPVQVCKLGDFCARLHGWAR